ncbi:CheR family methyltransferase [Maritalea porphyrae]|uniref:histidine kinase n=1 Tax=Maritalea porphyrae TaxID=880732 RepID=A0ABQ5UQX9_9HYPH|nr:CheR family methyltransferase [Maritalea porphyrae]GLQ17491.1 hypothetical protein GCM10007879_17400 [Maritalea porphyrae]
MVVIGASAGGLAPFEEFFGAVPIDSGLAFVIVQHLSPDFESSMDELLARHTKMQIRKVEDGMAIEENHVYLNRPHVHMDIKNGHFVVKPLDQFESPYLPINSFFEVAAREYGPQSIGVILSGTGSDGTKGCASIRAAGGGVFVQTPNSAKFEGMPNSVISAGLADIVTTPDDLPKQVIRFARNGTFAPQDGQGAGNPVLSSIFGLLRDRYGTDFEQYKYTTVARRIRRRAELCNINELSRYYLHLNEDRNELDALYNDLLIEVTSFFRDEKAFKALKTKVVPELVKKMAPDYQVRIWVPGCASGEEAYSIAILLAEAARKNKRDLNAKIIATDIHSRSLDVATEGVYSGESVAKISKGIIGRYFVPISESRYQVVSDIRRLVTFSPHSLLSDPPFTRMDLVSCRNVLIYLNDKAQQRAIFMFHFALRHKGFLFLGTSETPGKLADEFTAIDERARVFQKLRDVRLLEPEILTNALGMASASNGELKKLESRRSARAPNPNIEERRLIDSALQDIVKKYAPPGYLITTDGRIVHIFRDAAELLTLQTGNFTDKIAELLPRELGQIVEAGLERFKLSKSGTYSRKAVYGPKGGEAHTYFVTISRAGNPVGEHSYLLLTIEKSEVKPTDRQKNKNIKTANREELIDNLHRRTEELERDLASTEENLQTTIEELETSNEELQATNEELMASNEELQSTNEELHSVNEELFTVSSEHQRKIDELVELTNDMDNLLEGTEIGTIFLDSEFSIRRFTPAASETFNLLDGDIGRPINHLTHKFQFGELQELLKESRDKKRRIELEVEVDQIPYLLRILPYTTSGSGVDGIVITTINIKDLKEAQESVKKQAQYYASILSDITEYIIRWDKADGIVTYCNEKFAKLQGMSVDEIIGEHVSKTLSKKKFVTGYGGKDEQQHELDEIISGLKPNQTLPLTAVRRRENGKTEFRRLTVRSIADKSGKVVAYQATGRDATLEVNHQTALRKLMDVEMLSDGDYAERAEQFLACGLEYLGLDHALITQFGRNDVRQKYYVGSEPDAYGNNQAVSEDDILCSLVRRTNDIVAYSNLSKTDKVDHPAVAKFGVKCYLGCPVSVAGKQYGTIGFFSTKKARARKFTETELSYIRILAGWIGASLERANQFRAVRRSENILQHIFDGVTSAVWYKDDKNNILRANKTAAMWMGKTVEEIEGRNTADLLPDLSDRYFQEDLQAINSGKPLLDIIEHFDLPDGNDAWVKVDKVPFTDSETGEQTIVVVATDITELKTNEKRLIELNEELDQQKERYQSLYHKTPVMMHTLTPEATIIDVSDYWLKSLGYSRKKVIGRKIGEFQTPESAEHAAKNVIPTLEKNKTVENIQYQFVRKNGEIIDVELSGYLGETGREKQLLGVLVDVTERNRARQGLEDKNKELEQANEGLNQFAYVASHDLQEPLRKIRQFSELLVTSKKEYLDEEGRYFIDVVSQSARRMSNLIQDLLHLSKTNNTELNLAKENLNTVVQTILDELAVRIQEESAQIKVGKLPTIECDRILVEQLFRNIISNAIKYRSKDRPPVVKISAKKSKSGFVITISDNGVGFDERFKQKMFQPFTRIHSTAQYDGSGIGLAICAAVCDRHNWSISANGEVNKGATFKIVVS